jgi:tol-pal system protein YbgF
MISGVLRNAKIAGLAGVFVCGAGGAWAAQAPAAPVIDITSSGSRVRGGPSLDERVGKLERVLEDNTLEDFANRIDALQRELQKLQGDAEVINHGIEDLRRKQREMYLDLDRRIRKLELAPTSAAPADPNAQAQAAAAAEQRTAYDNAFALLRDGKYEEAIPLFEAFVKQYPAGDTSVNARYWLGEAYFVQRRYDVALVEFQTIVTQHPTAAKFSDALLKLGLTHYEMGTWDKSSQALNEVVARFPNTSQAQLATQRLEQLRQEGH